MRSSRRSHNSMPSPQKDDHDPFNTRRPEVFKLRGWRWLVFYPVALLLILYLRSIRFRMNPETRERISGIPHPRMIVLWHNRDMIAPEVIRRFLVPERTAALISPSRMAAWQAAFFQAYRFRVVRGSTTRRSVQAGIELMRAMREGYDVATAPDGPSGPLYSYQEGSIAIARKVKAPVIMVMPNCRMAYRAGNWDRTLWPMPFAKVDIQVKIVAADDPLWEKSSTEVASEFRRVCLELTDDPFTFEDHG